MQYIPKTAATRAAIAAHLEGAREARYLSDEERRRRLGQPNQKKVACLQIAIRSLCGDSYPFSTFVENMKKVL